MNKWTRFIDSCVGNIARKIQDEFDESKHPRDKGGKFTSKGGEGRGGGKKEKLVHTHKAGDITPERADALNEAAVALEEAGVPKQKILKMSNEGDLEGMQKLLESSKNSSESKEGSDVDADDRDEDEVRYHLKGQLSMLSNHPDWMNEEDMRGIKKDMRKLGMHEEIALLEDKKALNAFKKQAVNGIESIDENEVEEMLTSMGVARSRLKNADIYKKAKEHIKQNPIEAHAALRKQNLLKYFN